MQPIHLEFTPDVKHFHARPYPVSNDHKKIFLAAMMWMRKGVLAPHGVTEFAFPTFIRPKKDDRMRWVSDFWRLPDMLIRKQYGITRIQEILHRHLKHEYMTKIDTSLQQFYMFDLH